MPTITTEEILNSEVRALSWKQPYAELMLHGKQETRKWATPYRGLVLICASALPYADRELIEIAGPEQYARILQTLGKKWFNSVKRQNAIAIGRLTGSFCSELWERKPLEFEAKTFVEFKPGLRVHVYEDVAKINPFPWKGLQGWKTLKPEEKQLIHLL